MKKTLFVLIFLLICIFALSACSQDFANTDGTLPNQPDDDTTSDETLECDHAFGDWVTSKEATCSEEGQSYRVCSKCLKEETKKIAKTDEHNFSIQNTNAMFLAADATCTSPATYYYSCTCGEKGTDVFEYGDKSSEHLYNDENTCTVCSNYKDADVVFTFNTQTNTYHVTDYKGNATEIVIPSVYKGFPVSSIGEFAFCECKTITAVKLPSSIVSIGRCAFSYCTALSKLAIPDNVVSIGEEAFRNCSSLKSVTLGKGIQKINESTFAECISLEAIEFPSNITEIGGTAFYGCTALTEVVIPDTVTLIGTSAFGDCTNLRKVTLPFLGDKKTNPSNGTFKYIFDYTYTPSVKEVILTGGNYCGLAEQIPNNAFDGYSSLEKIVLPDTIVIIGDRAFCETSLSDIQLPDSLGNIGDEAFLGCNFTTFTIPDNVTIMGEYMLVGNPIESLTLPFIGENNSQQFGELSYILGDFAGLSHSLKEVNVTVGNKYGDHCLIPNSAFQNWISIKTINLPEGITSIGQYAFYGCKSLQNINIPESVGSIGPYAFFECTALTSINIPNGIIIDFAFYGCTALTEINLGSVSSIGEGAFRGCTSLKRITIPNSVTKIGISAFAECDKLEEMSIPFTGSQAGFNASIKYFGYIFAGNWGADPDPSVYQNDVPETLKTVYYTSGEDMLWHNAFESCYHIENIYISEGLETIGDEAFRNSAIKYISLPKSLTTIGANAFEDCILLESIVLGDNITTIHDNAFENTTALKNVYFRGTEEEWNALMENVREEYLYPATKHYNYIV